jgi:hypothetical protein
MIVITLYSYEGLTLAEIGQVLGVTASPVCQLHTKAVLKLRAKMQDAGRPLNASWEFMLHGRVPPRRAAGRARTGCRFG